MELLVGEGPDGEGPNGIACRGGSRWNCLSGRVPMGRVPIWNHLSGRVPLELLVGEGPDGEGPDLELLVGEGPDGIASRGGS